jgi:hypothetical protein
VAATLGIMDRYIEASPRGRWIIFIYILLQIAIFLFAIAAEENIKGSTINPSPNIESAFVSTLYTTWLYLSFELVWVYIGIRVIKSKQWPPYNMAVPVKIKITACKKTTLIGVFLLIFFLISSFHVYFQWKFYIWHKTAIIELQQSMKENKK